MADTIKYWVESYYDLMDNQSDQRVKDWFLMSSPFPTMFISIFYAIFMKKIGPKLMENRKPFELKKTIIVYNALQVAFSTWLFYEACMAGWLTGYSYRCQPTDFSTSPNAMRMARGCWWYFISKFSEFLDTLFFVLRKKNRHISNLHVIHHGIMPFSVWWGVKFMPGGQSTFFGFLNTFVHIIMYSYYLLAALGPQYQKYLWWKKYLTLLQMVQFIAVMVHTGQLLFIECDYPKSFSWFIGGHAVLFYFLFSNFYKETYVKKDKKDDGDSKKSSKGTIGVCFSNQSPLYENAEKLPKMTNSYTSSNSSDNLRNRAFINKENGKAN